MLRIFHSVQPYTHRTKIAKELMTVIYLCDYKNISMYSHVKIAESHGYIKYPRIIVFSDSDLVSFVSQK